MAGFKWSAGPLAKSSPLRTMRSTGVWGTKHVVAAPAPAGQRQSTSVWMNEHTTGAPFGGVRSPQMMDAAIGGDVNRRFGRASTQRPANYGARLGLNGDRVPVTVRMRANSLYRGPM